jgi:hypothetical protein
VFVKKFFVLLCVLVLVAGFAVAEDIGLTVGVEFNNENINQADGDPTTSTIAPFIIYENTSLLDGALTLHTGLESYYIHLEREPGSDGDYFPQDFDFNIWLQYKLSVGSASTLRFYLRDDNSVEVSPVHHGTTYTTTAGTLTPGIQFNQKMGFGSLYARLRAPINYLADDTEVRLQSRLGWNSNFDLGLWAEVRSRLTQETDLYQSLRLNANYAKDTYELNLFTIFPKEVSSGITINPTFDYYFENSTVELDFNFTGVGSDDGISLTLTPYFEYCVGAWTFYTSFEFANVTKNGGDMSISPTLGVSFSF